MAYLEHTNATLLELSRGGYRAATIWDAHDGRDGGPINVGHVISALDDYKRAPRADEAEYADRLDRTLNDSSDRLLGLAEACLQTVANRGAGAGEEADEILALIEDRLTSLRARLLEDV